MKKSEFIDATKGMFNEIRRVGKVKIARVTFQSIGWKIVTSNDWTEAVNQKDNRFSTRDDLWLAIK